MKRAARTMVLAALLLLGGCDDDAEEATPAVSTTALDRSATTAPTTTAAPATTTTSATGAEDWDGVRFDFGIIDRIDRTEDGRTLVVFDRTQIADDPPRSAPDFTEEPIYFGNTDVVYLNDNPRLRTYVAARTVEVLRLANPQQACSGLTDERQPPVWRSISVDDVVDGALWEDFDQVALTFDADGRVTRIRLSSGC